jgi:hypothetical protein
MFASFVPAVWLDFMMTLAQRRGVEKRMISWSYIFSIIFAFCSLSSLVVKNSINSLDHFHLIPGPLHHFFVLFFILGTFYTLIRLLFSLKVFTGVRKNQIIYIIWAFCFGMGGGGLYFISIYFKKEPFPHDFLVVAYPAIVAYAIAKYRLMDITVAITRTTIFIAVYTLVLGVPFAVAWWMKDWLIEVFGANWWFLPLGLMAALATSGPFLYIFFQRRAEEALLKEQRRYQQTLSRPPSA